MILIVKTPGSQMSFPAACGRTIPCRQYGDSGLVEAARYAAQGKTGCFFNLARRGVVDRLADAPFTLAFSREIEKFIIRQPPMGGKDDYDSENSWISDGLPSSSRRRRRGGGRVEREVKCKRDRR